ncbi:MAG: hypothetical protein ACR2RB_17375, partial [Gammaproteobacteria bacterium]
MRTQCLDPHNPSAVDACRRLSARYQHDIAALVSLGRQLDKKRNHSAAVAVYEQGLAYCQSGKPCPEINRKGLARLYVLARSNAREAERVGTARTVDPDHISSVASRVDEIKCKHLRGAAAVEACKNALRSAGDDAELHARLAEALREAGRVAPASSV